MRVPFSTLASAIATAFASSFASLDGSGKVPASRLPSYVDDVLEYANIGAFPATGESGKIYVSTATGLCYRWTSSIYVEISSSPGSTDAVAEGSINKYFTDARVRTAKTPTSATAAGNAGQIAWDANYIYVCTAVNTWKRSQLLTW